MYIRRGVFPSSENELECQKEIRSSEFDSRAGESNCCIKLERKFMRFLTINFKCTYLSPNKILFIKIKTIAINALLPTKNKFCYSGWIKFWRRETRWMPFQHLSWIWSISHARSCRGAWKSGNRWARENLRRLCPAMVNRNGPLLLHDNARPHGARPTLQKLNELGYGTLSTSPAILLRSLAHRLPLFQPPRQLLAWEILQIADRC